MERRADGGVSPSRRRDPKKRAVRAPRPGRGRKWWLWALAAVAVAVVLVWRFVPRPRAGREARILFPDERLTSLKPVVRFEDFAGSESCAACHATQYAAWKRSTHGRAGGPPSRNLLIARFDGTPIRFKDATVTPSVSGRGEHLFTVARQGHETIVLKVDGVVGGGHMAGGGTQGFVSRYPDGTLRFLPFDFVKQEGVWFCNTASRSGKGWIPITVAVSLLDCGDWPPARVLGDEPRFANCQSCHGSQIESAFDTSSHRFVTRYQSLSVNCESCHGPGKMHVELATTGDIAGREDIGILSPALLPKDQSLTVCFQCHAVKDQVRPGYLSGAPLPAHYSIALQELGDRPHFPDGRIRTFAYQETHLYSDCYLNGGMTCTSCHDPHSQGYRDVAGNALPDRYADGQCLGCHASKTEPLALHTKHAAESPGSRCVSCHMPYLQQPDVGRTIRYARSDHTIPIPRPAFDAELGIVSACRQCHAGQSPASLETQTRQWWGALKPHPEPVSKLLRARSVTSARGAAPLLLIPDARHRMAQFSGIAEFAERFLAPDMAKIDRGAVKRLERLAESDDMDVRAMAMASLHLARGTRPEIRRYLSARLRALEADENLVRDRWSTILGYFGDSYRGQGRPAEAVLAYRKALEIRPRNARLYLNLGLAHHDEGEFARAIESYRESVRLDATQPLAFVNLGNTLLEVQDFGGAIAAYRRAIALNPREPLAHFNLGNAFARQWQHAGAVEAYREAAALDPSLALAHFYLARSLIQLREYSRARDAVRNGLEFDASNEAARDVLRRLEILLEGQPR